MKIVVICASLMVGCLSQNAAAQTVTEIDSVDALTLSTSLGSTSAVHAAAYHCSGTLPCPADGGEGLFIKHLNICTPDGGRVVKDGLGNCWYRQNLNGDLRQYGVTVGSQYDCSTGVSACADSEPILALMQTAATAAGLYSLTTSGVQIRLEETFPVDDYVTLDAGAAPLTGNNTLLGLPGTIWLDHGATMSMGRHSQVQHVALLPTWYGSTYPSGASGLLDSYDIVAAMVSNSDTGITCTGSATDCHVNNSLIAGFDTGIETSGPSSVLDWVRTDANVCYYMHDSGSATHWGQTTCGPKITTADEEFWTITSVTDNGSGLCRLTLAQNPSFNFSDIAYIASHNYNSWVSGFTSGTGGANANGRWIPTNYTLGGGGTTATIDLANSSCHGTNLGGPTGITAKTAIGSPTLRSVSSVANLSEGQTVTGTGIPSGTTIDAIGVSNGLIGLTKAAIASGTITLSITGGATGSLGTCSVGSSGSTGPCFMLTGSERIDAGLSDGGKAAGGSAGGAGCATAYLVGGFVSTSIPSIRCHTGDAAGAEKVSGFDIYSPFCYAHAICFHLANAYSSRMTSAGMDATRNLGDDDTAFGLIDGNMKSVTFLGGKAGKVGAGVVIDPTGTDKGCVNLESSNLGVFEVDQGCVLVRGADGSADYMMISDAATHVQMDGYLPSLNIYYENDPASASIASSITDTSGMIVKSGPSWWGGFFTPGGPALPDGNISCGTGASVRGNNSYGRITAGSGGATSCTVNFYVLGTATGYPNQAVCRFTDETHPATVLVPTSSSKTSVTASTVPNTATITSGDIVSYNCGSWQN